VGGPGRYSYDRYPLPRSSHEQTLRRHRTALTACPSLSCLLAPATRVNSIRSPRLRYASRSWSPVQRASAGRMTILAMNKRTFTRAAGVSPPWFGRHLYADTRAIARKTADSLWADHRCHRVQRYHGGLTPPALGCTVPVRRRKRLPRCAPNFAAKSDIRGARTHVHKSGGRQPAVVSGSWCRKKCEF
jgi:hypothetical protein